MAFETIHGMRQRSRSSLGNCTLKIDIAKAYDRVNWDYLSAMLNFLGLSLIWVQWMQMCFSNVNYLIAVNGKKIGPIIPGRGLRHGDPISPCFLLWLKGCLYCFKIESVKMSAYLPSIFR